MKTAIAIVLSIGIISGIMTAQSKASNSEIELRTNSNKMEIIEQLNAL